MNKKIELIGVVISIENDPLQRYFNDTVVQINKLTEAQCKDWVSMIDNGDRYSNDSRYQYLSRYQGKNDIGFGNAKACVQGAIIKKLKPKSLTEYIRIEKNE